MDWEEIWSSVSEPNGVSLMAQQSHNIVDIS